MSQKSVEKSGQFVVPGERLAVIEELLSGPGTYAGEDGTIYSSITGQVSVDTFNKIVAVYPRVHLPVMPHEGSVVLGQVSSVQDKGAAVQIFKVGRKYLSSGLFTGSLHVSMVNADYVKTMFDAFKVGDIIRAKVVSDKNLAYQLSTVDRTLGVLYAFCSRCGFPLMRKRNLQCQVCKNVEERKLAPDYGEAAF